MRIVSRIALILLICGLALMGCRKEDAEPHYNYYGGTGGSEPSDEMDSLQPPAGEPADLTEDEGDDVQSVDYEMIDITACTNMFQQENGYGFITSDTELDTHWAQWCPSVEVPDVDFEKNIIGYYFVTEQPCEDISFKGVHTDGENIVVDIEREREKASEGRICMCTLMLKKQHFIFSTALMGDTPTISEAITQVPCKSEMEQPAQ